MNNPALTVADDLLNIRAVSLRPEEPFTWASGLHSPIYTDNRLTIAYPDVRRHIYLGMTQLIKKRFSNVEVIAGTATAGIPHAAWVAEKLSLPMIYVRTKAKDHGQGRQIEGVMQKGQRVVVIDDLISTGGSVLNAVRAVEKAGGKVVGVVAVFTYGLEIADKNFRQIGVPYYAVTNYSILLQQAQASRKITSSQMVDLQAWRKNPLAWSKRYSVNN